MALISVYNKGVCIREICDTQAYIDYESGLVNVFTGHKWVTDVSGAAKITRRVENGIVHYTVILPDEAQVGETEEI